MTTVPELPTDIRELVEQKVAEFSAKIEAATREIELRARSVNPGKAAMPTQQEWIAYRMMKRLGIDWPESGRLNLGVLNDRLTAARCSTDERFQIKGALAEAGVIDP